jgi:hypothetical protein
MRDAHSSLFLSAKNLQNFQQHRHFPFLEDR